MFSSKTVRLSLKSILTRSSLFFALITLSIASSATAPELESWSYDPGPSVEDDMGEMLIDINARIPNMPEVSKKVMGRQNFRPAYGPIPWRMPMKENGVKILFIGQDGTHIAEAAGRPATAGFGGRAQDLASYFGVSYSAAFINTYAFTIKGQYAYRNTPYIYSKDGETPKIAFDSITDNGTWLITQDQRSPIVKWRNDLIDWIITNNKESLKLIVLFGGAARDSAGAFIISKGGEVGTKTPYSLGKGVKAEELLEMVRVPLIKLNFSGGNNKVPSPVDSRGRDLYPAVLGEKVNYKDQKSVNAAMKALRDNLGDALEKMVFTNGGKDGSGLLHPAQLGGYDLGRIKISGQKSLNKYGTTISLKGLELRDGSKIGNDILVVQLPHPTYLSNVKRENDMKKSGSGSRMVKDLVMKKVNLLKPYRDQRGWEIEPDEGEEDFFGQNKDYEYRRADIGSSYYDFGTPANRMVSVSSAKRLGPSVILLGMRDTPNYDKSKVREMKEMKPAERLPRGELFSARPRTPALRYKFDPGPGEKYAKIMKENLNLRSIFRKKPGKSFSKNGIETYDVKSHPAAADFGHYRGTFVDPSVVILADPDGYDDILTARALTGERGQYLQGLMDAFGIGDKYLVIKTVPFAMDGATDDEWKRVLQKTENYREELLYDIVKNPSVKLVIADGKYARKEIDRMQIADGIDVVKINRGSSKDSGIEDAMANIDALDDFKVLVDSVERLNIPRTHLSYYSRVWEGTSGDSVITSTDLTKGRAFLVVAPDWVTQQRTRISAPVQKSVDELIEALEEGGLPRPGERAGTFLKRRFGSSNDKPAWDAEFEEAS